MTEKDKEIQDLRRKYGMVKTMLEIVVVSCKACRFCKYADADCMPTDCTCEPELNWEE